MTRFSAAAAILSIAALASFAAHAQTVQAPSDSRCFPWQDFRDGRCVPKPTVPAPPLPADSHLCSDGARSLSGPCTCAEGTHLDAQSNGCVADAAPLPAKPAEPRPPAPPPTLRPDANVPCDGGTLRDGQCACPTGFKLMPAAGGDGIGGGICVKTDADKCLGGELTVTGTCLCNSQVVMSGETYDLEFVQGKCLPKRCPVQTMLKEGKCVAISAGAPERIEPQHGKPSVPGEASEEEVRRHPCGHGMIRTRSGCMHAHRRYPGPVGSRIYQRLGY